MIGNKLVLFLKELHDDFQNDIGETKLDQLYDLAYGNVWKHLNIKPPTYEIESIRERHIKLSDDDIKKLKHRKKKMITEQNSWNFVNQLLNYQTN